MRMLWTLLVALLAATSVGAQELPELSAIVFRARSLSGETPPLATEAAARAAERRSSRATEPARASPVLSAEELSARIDRYLAAFAEEQSRTSERSTTLIDPLLSLAALYQDAGNQNAAIAALEQAISVYRINSGLHSLDQVDAVESLVASKRAKGQYAEAATVEQYLQNLASRNPDDPRVASVITRLADMEMVAARELLDIPPPPQIEYVSSRGWFPRLPTIRSPALKALLAARRHYGEAIVAGARTGTESVAELLSLEHRLVDTLYFELEHPRLRYYEELQLLPLPGIGARMLQVKIDTEVKFNQSAAKVAEAMIELGDWYLMFAGNGAALEQYEAAYDLLVADGLSSSEIGEIVSPAIPVMLPAFPGAAADPPRRGYVDAAVEIGPYGNARSVHIIATSPDAPRIMTRRLRQYVERVRFRPRFIDGHLARSDLFTARFFYDY